MPQPETPLHPATEGELEQALAHALRFDGRKRIHTSDEMMAKITASHLVEQLRLSGFVVMKKPPAPAHGPPPTYMPNKHLTD